MPKGQNGPWGDLRIVSPRFFDALRIPLKKGRVFTDQDRLGASPVAIIDEQSVKKYFANEDPIGRRITFGAAPGKTDSDVDYDRRRGRPRPHEGLDAEPLRIQYYFPSSQSGIRFLNMAVRTTGNPTSVLPAAREAVHSIDRDLPISTVSTMDKLVESSVGQRKLSMILLGVFSVIALLLASIGIYGVMSYSVTQRTRELGIRMALGAARSRVLALVVGQGMILAATGVGIGLVAAFAAHSLSVEPTLWRRGRLTQRRS